MSRYLKVFEVHASVEHPLDDAALAVAKMFDYLLPKKIGAGGFAKISVLLMGEPVSGETVVDSLDVAIVKVFVDRYAEIAAETDVIGRRKALLSYIVKGASEFCRKHRLDDGVFHETAALIEAKGYQFSDCFLPEKRNPGRKLAASCCFDCNDVYDIYLTVRDVASGVADRVLLTKSKAWSPSLVVSSIRWSGGAKAQCLLPNKRDYWEYDVLNKRLTFRYPRAEDGDPHGQYDFAMMYLNGLYVETDIVQAVYWLEKSAAQNFKPAARLLEKLRAPRI